MTKLAEILREALGVAVEVCRDDVNVYWSTFETRIVECKAGGERLRLFCKVGPTDHESGHGHRGGVAREAEVYRLLLAPDGLGPRFRGSAPANGSTWLVVDYLADALRVAKSGSAALAAAARWAGAFHARHERVAPEFLPAYDADYYLGWSRRALELVAEPRVRLKLGRLCGRYEDSLPTLLDAPQTVIHGEFTPNNILVDDGDTYPVDWESAAVGPGEIDLATLVHRWDEPSTRAAVRAYRDARWPGGAPPAHGPVFEAAQLHWLLRWVGDEEVWRTDPRAGELLEEVLAV
jgi:hypothetical protein